jgi:hypothetical protein
MSELKIGCFEDLAKEQRRALRTRARMQRKLANGVKLCGAQTRQGRPSIATALGNGRCRNHGGLSNGREDSRGQGEISVEAEAVSAAAQGRCFLIDSCGPDHLRLLRRMGLR